jgi:simple sugar transport system ATP-binding protein
LLAVRGVSKAFPGIQALAGVDFTVQRGQIHTLLGQNGAGKSTLIKVITGVYRPDAGEIRLNGIPIAPPSPLAAQELGISTVYQEVNLVPSLSVAENVLLGREPTRCGCIRWRELNRQAVAALARLDLRLDVTLPLGDYPIAVQQLVAVARALSVAAQVLVLDEPTSSLDEAEVRQLFAVMRRLRADGMGIVFISHFLHQVYEISDRFTVLRNGRLVGEYEPAALPRLELIAALLGCDTRAAGALTNAGARAPATNVPRPFLRVQGFGRRGAVAPLDLEIRAGEVLGLAGLLGSGRTETAKMLFGVTPADRGSAEVEGRPCSLRSPAEAIAAGLGFCPEDRKTEGLIPNLSVRANIILALQASRGWFHRLSRARQEEIAQHYVKALNIATPDLDRPVRALSGGNQQKVVLGRWLAAQRQLLILDEPTRGIDVGAKAEIEKEIAALCDQGMAILFISSELDEVVRCAQRVAVLRDRHKIGELVGADIDLAGIVAMIAAPESSPPEAAHA